MNKKKIISFVILIVGIVCLGAGICMNLFFTTTKKGMFTNALTQSMENIIPGVQELANSLAPTKAFSYDKNTPVTLVTDTSLVNYDETISLKGNMIVDVANTKGYGNLSVGIDNASALLEMYIQDTRLYFKVKNAFKKFYYMDMEEDSTIESSADYEELEKLLSEVFTEEEVDKILDYLKESIVNNITEDNFIEEEVELQLGGSTFETTKLTLDITDKLVADIMVDFLTSVKNDMKLVNAFNKLGQMLYDYLADDEEEAEKFDAVELIDEKIAKFKEETSVEVLCSYSMYLENKKNVLRHEFVMPSKDENTEDSKIILNGYQNSNKYNNYELMLLSGNSEIVVIKLIGTAANTKSIVVNVVGQTVVTGKYEQSNSKCSIELEMADDTEKISLAYLYEIVEADKEVRFDLELSAASLNEVYLELSSKNTITVGGTIPSVDISNSDSYENITQEELDAVANIFSSLQM